jgi:hypothetical protein
MAVAEAIGGKQGVCKRYRRDTEKLGFVIGNPRDMIYSF